MTQWPRPSASDFLSIHPPALWTCLCFVSWVPGGAVSDRVEAELFPPVQSWFKVKGQGLRSCWTRPCTPTVSPSLNYRRWWTMFGSKMTGRCAWFYLTGCFCPFKSSAPRCLENMHMMWMCECFFHQDVRLLCDGPIPPWAKDINSNRISSVC